MSKGRKYTLAAMIIPLVVMFVWWRTSSHFEHQADKVATNTVTTGPQSDPFTKVIAQGNIPSNGKWSEMIELPDPAGPSYRLRPDVPVKIRVYDPNGKLIPEREIGDSRDPKANFFGLTKGSKIQVASLIPDAGGNIKFLISDW